jgi:hypothetical protein
MASEKRLASEPEDQQPIPSESTFVLLARARAGDDRALEPMFARYLPRLRRWASGRLPRWARDQERYSEPDAATGRHLDRRGAAIKRDVRARTRDRARARERYEAALTRLRPMDREAIDSLLDYKKKQIALTLEGVRFFDSAGLGEIVRISTP